MKLIPLILSAILCNIFNNPAVAQPSPEILSKYNSLNPIVARWGLEVNQDWDALLEIALNPDPKLTEQNIKQAYNIILGAKIGPGQETASYVLDLYKIFKQNPSQLVEQSRKYFGGINQCLLYWLIPKTQFIEIKEFNEDMKKALEKDSKNKTLIGFNQEAQKYFKALKAGKNIPVLQKCNLFSIKKNR